MGAPFSSPSGSEITLAPEDIAEALAGAVQGWFIGAAGPIMRILLLVGALQSMGLMVFPLIEEGGVMQRNALNTIAVHIIFLRVKGMIAFL